MQTQTRTKWQGVGSKLLTNYISIFEGEKCHNVIFCVSHFWQVMQISLVSPAGVLRCITFKSTYFEATEKSFSDKKCIWINAPCEIFWFHSSLTTGISVHSVFLVLYLCLIRRVWSSHGSLAKIPLARPNKPDMPPKSTKKVRLVFTVPKFSPKFSVQVRDLIS